MAPTALRAAGATSAPYEGALVPSGWLAVSALFGSLFWSLHPLRVESVAWVTERRDVLSGLFFIGTVLCYLEWTRTTRRAWFLGAIAAHLLSLLGKAIGMTMPFVLLILDVYPLRRLPPDIREWFLPGYRERLWEKLPFLAAGCLFAALTWKAQQQGCSNSLLLTVSPWDMLIRAGHALFFYLEKMLVPWGLSPCYEMPVPFNPFDGRLLGGGAAALVLGWLVWLKADRFPGAVAATAYYAVTVSPVLGFVCANVLAADRYTYLPTLGFSVLAAAGMLALLRGPSVVRRRAVLILAAGLCVTWGALSRRQCRFWRDSNSLWARVLSLQPATAVALHNLGVAAQARGDIAMALRFLRRERILWPNARLPRQVLSEMLYNQGNAMQRAGNHAAAISSYQEALGLAPGFAEAHNNLGLALAGSGQAVQACRCYAQALSLSPGFAAALYNWGNALAELGDLAQAQEKYRKALRLDESLLDARFNLANTLARQGFYRGAAAQYRALLHRAPGFPGARENLAKVLSLGRF